jgi:disulfide oxidoreductase YuzD
MDPITTAIIAALAAGVTQGTVSDLYNGLKQLIKTKYCNRNDLIISIEKLEQKPKSNARQMELQEQIEENQLNEDINIVDLAKKLMDEIKSSGDEKHIMQAKGKFIAQADHGSAANVTINR